MQAVSIRFLFTITFLLVRFPNIYIAAMFGQRPLSILGVDIATILPKDLLWSRAKVASILLSLRAANSKPHQLHQARVAKFTAQC